MSKIGYIRVSTEQQETARQQEIMCGCQADRMSPAKNRAHCFLVCVLLFIFFAAENARRIHYSCACCGQQQGSK